MDFKIALIQLVGGFEAERIRYAIIGGVALGLLGEVRATLHIDFLIHKEDLSKIERLMAKLGFKKIFSTDNVSQYEHADIPTSRVDFIHAFRDISLSMLKRAKSVTIGKGTKARVAMPEDVIGLKVQSMANDPARRSKDLADIEALMRHGTGLDWQILSEYFTLFGMKGIFDELKKKIHEAH